MANNRLFLVHRPTGYAIYLGKRMLRGWYPYPASDLETDFAKFYDRIDAEYGSGADKAILNQDDFILVLEDNVFAKHIPELIADEGEADSLIIRFGSSVAE